MSDSILDTDSVEMAIALTALRTDVVAAAASARVDDIDAMLSMGWDNV